MQHACLQVWSALGQLSCAFPALRCLDLSGYTRGQIILQPSAVAGLASCSQLEEMRLRDVDAPQLQPEQLKQYLPRVRMLRLDGCTKDFNQKALAALGPHLE